MCFRQCDVVGSDRGMGNSLLGRFPRERPCSAHGPPVDKSSSLDSLVLFAHCGILFPDRRVETGRDLRHRCPRFFCSPWFYSVCVEFCTVFSFNIRVCSCFNLYFLVKLKRYICSAVVFLFCTQTPISSSQIPSCCWCVA